MSDLEAVSLKLEARGHRVTPSRRAVIAAALQQAGHFSIDDLLHRCRGAGRATVFRTIRLLTDLGVVCRVLLDDGSLHYRVSERASTTTTSSAPAAAACATLTTARSATSCGSSRRHPAMRSKATGSSSTDNAGLAAHNR